MTETEFTLLALHELRTPLGTIKQVIEIMLEGIDGELTDKQAGRLDIAKRNVLRLEKLTADILNFTKLETGHTKMAAKKVDLNHLLNPVDSSVKTRAEERNIDLTCEVPNQPVELLCDPDGIKQAIMNILNSSIVTTDDEGKIVLKISESGDDVRIDVEGSGPGFNEDELPKLFIPFNKKRVRSKSDYESGLGLSLSKLIVDAHGGRTEVKKGISFSVFLPKHGLEDKA